jgi:hypothetical protein
MNKIVFENENDAKMLVEKYNNKEIENVKVTL